MGAATTLALTSVANNKVIEVTFFGLGLLCEVEELQARPRRPMKDMAADDW